MSASAGRVLIIPKGDYNSATTYNMLDMVFYGGKSYICKQTSTGNDPTNTVYWQIMIDGASEFSALSDVQLNNLQDGDGIFWDATAQKWKNTSPVGIQVTSPPAKVDYIAGEILDLTGMVVSAIYSSGTTRNITTECTFSPANGATLTASNTTVTVSWRTYSATQTITVENAVYGVEWDGSSSPAMSRTDGAVGFVDPVPQMSDGNDGWTTGSSPFDNIMPWSGMEIVEDTNAGTLVKIPKFWYKLSQPTPGVGLKVQISNRALTGYHVSPAHMDRGDGQGERDFVYVGRYVCGRTVIKSATATMPYNNISRATARTNIHNLGADIWQWDYCMRFTIQLLYLVEFANWDSQSKIGTGGGSLTNTGYTNSMTYHTGTNRPDTAYAPGTQYRHIEGLWDNGYEWLDGVRYVYNKGDSIILNPSEFSDTANGISTNTMYSSNCPLAVQIVDVEGLFPLFLPIANTNSDYTIGICDQWKLGTSTEKVVQCGGTGSSALIGLFYTIHNSETQSGNSITTRLMKLPANS